MSEPGHDGAVLVVLRLSGPPDAVRDACRRAEDAVGMPPGLLARAVAPTADGAILVNVWADEEARRTSNEDPAHREALRESGLADVVASREVEVLPDARVTLGATG